MARNVYPILPDELVLELEAHAATCDACRYVLDRRYPNHLKWEEDDGTGIHQEKSKSISGCWILRGIGEDGKLGERLIEYLMFPGDYL